MKSNPGYIELRKSLGELEEKRKALDTAIAAGCDLLADQYAPCKVGDIDRKSVV
jgi:hypothetical protein